MDKLVVNLSDTYLTKEQTSVLAKGLNFCPTPGSLNPGELRSDLDCFHRKLRLTSYFYDEEEELDLSPTEGNYFCFDEFSHPKFKLPSKFNPTGPPTLEAFITLNEHDFNYRQVQGGSLQPNLTQGEQFALKQLKQMKDIVLKAADKGRATVIQSRSQYLTEGFRQLSDPSFYEKLGCDLTDAHRKEINDFISTLHQTGEIDDSVYEYLLNQECRTPILYFLPKIHKGTTPFVKGRPMSSLDMTKFYITDCSSDMGRLTCLVN